MEDAHEAIAHFDGDPSMSFFAVYDGHGGERVARGSCIVCGSPPAIPVALPAVEGVTEDGVGEEKRANVGGAR